MLDLSKLSEFNHALVYSFEPESSPQRLAGSQTYEDALYPEAGQYHDMLDAYLYAQENILPLIKKEGIKNIKPETLIQWVKKLHSHLGKTLLQIHDKQAGEFTQEFILRWHKGNQLVDHFIYYLAGLHPHKPRSSFVSFLNEDFGLDKQATSNFISLLEKIADDKTYTIHESQIPYINYKHPAIHGIIAINKLATAYNLDQLTYEQKKIVNNIVKICMLPKLIPAAMEQWAGTTVCKLSELDTNDIGKVTEFLTFVFYELTEIHPFANANGRTATCLINLFLRAFDYPSIVLRHPGERKNQNSQYQQAFAQIDSSLLPLQKLIHTRIVEAQKDVFEDKKLKKLIEIRVGFSDLLQQIKRKHPTFDVNRFQQESAGAPETKMALEMENLVDASTFLLSAALTKLAQIEKKLDNEKQKKLMMFQPAPLDRQQIPAILDAVKKITGLEGWKQNANSGVIWLEFPDMDMQKARKAASKLEQTKALRVTVAPRLDNKIPVLKCENIDYQKLTRFSGQNEVKTSQVLNM